ncbi:MAG: polysaccharide deacetylase family protein [Desulfovibrio sp.]|nr:polysaccharide deacetylase family protein [Desulfovibrio sp.]
MPVHILPPLAQEERGLIRNVTPEKGEKVLALTFDLCELDTSTTGCDMDLLGYLHREGCAATLFMGGKWMRSHEKRVKQIMRTPLFEIGNHAWSHGNAALLTKKGLQAQILWTQAEYERLREDLQHSAKVSGETLPPSPAVPHLFRLPYGRCTVEALQIIADLGLRTVQWDIPAEGRPVRSQQEAARAAKALLSRIKPGSILLLHANRVPTGTALLVKELVPLLRKSGYRFCTVGELLEMGKANISWDGYFDRPKDNHGLDRRFGVDGTGRKKPFLGEE